MADAVKRALILREVLMQAWMIRWQFVFCLDSWRLDFGNAVNEMMRVVNHAQAPQALYTNFYSRHS